MKDLDLSIAVDIRTFDGNRSDFLSRQRTAILRERAVRLVDIAARIHIEVDIRRIGRNGNDVFGTDAGLRSIAIWVSICSDEYADVVAGRIRSQDENAARGKGDSVARRGTAVIQNHDTALDDVRKPHVIGSTVGKRAEPRSLHHAAVRKGRRLRNHVLLGTPFGQTSEPN